MDEIQRKLALIDRQLAGEGLHKRIIATSPLLFPALGLMAGILIQDGLAAANQTASSRSLIWLWLAVLTICAGGTVLLFVLQSDMARPKVMAYAALVCFVCLGAIRLTCYHQPPLDDIRNLVGGEAKLATIRGLILSDPRRQNRQWQFARFLYTDPSCSFYLKLTEVKTVTGWANVTGTVRAQVDEPVLDLRAGDHIQAYCWLERFREPTNPGQFNTAKYLARKNVFIAASIGSRDSIELSSSGSAGRFLKFKGVLRAIAGRALLGDMDVEGENYGLLQALTLGYRAEIDTQTYKAFQETGLLHFVSLSGMNFVILIGIIWWLCKTAGLMKPARALVCLAATGIFFLVVPPNAPAVRAAIMSSVFCASFFFRRKPNTYNSLSLAAIILLLVRPTSLFEADWQLSFASVLGILLFTEPIANFMHEKVIDRLEQIDSQRLTPFLRLLSRLTTPIIVAFAVSLAAWLATAGILIHHFYTINHLTSLWTVLVSPLIGAVSIIGYVKILLSLLLPSTAAMLDMIVGPLSALLIRIVRLIGSWNISQICIGRVSPAIVILYYGFVLFAFFAHFRRPLVKTLICTVAAAVLVTSLAGAKWHRTHRDSLILTCLNVGHGQAILAQLPGSANMLFDAGSLNYSDIGTRVIVPFLNYSGISRIHAIIISHNDIDHINGLPEIAEHCKVNNVYANDAFFTDAENWGAAKFLNQCLVDKGLPIKPLDKTSPFSGDVHITALWPKEGALDSNQLSENDRSQVLLVEFAGVKILLCSDIEKRAQTELLRLYPGLKADAVIVPHHGSKNTLAADFLDSLEPDILICSCAKAQYEKQQTFTPPTHIKSLYTAKDGAITVCVAEDGSIRTTTFTAER